ncbi:MAG: serine/threonine protein kinase, partial [Deltaproteobacteria bacterium]|nr:serine/threonine protein kinase [Deltaproteobacteria bacterium]MBW2537370.1 serine/threonine protein kinase [Deltaproteobacteria bacterium]
MPIAPGLMVTPNVRLVELLGSGGMGSVWVADHLSLDTKVAVKFVAKEVLEEDDLVLARFTREAALAAQIKSPHVVQIFDHGLTPEGIPFMVMELLEGEDLGQRIERDGPLGLQDMRVVLTQTAKALAKAHKLAIVHRDIKPENLFLVEPEFDLFVKVLDFGIAKQTRMPNEVSLTTTGDMVGTPQFMSPEQVLSSKAVDHRADLWALGVVTYFALTGQVPFNGETLGAVCVAIAAGKYAPVSTLRPDLPRALDGWFLRALADLPEERFQSARDMVLAFAECLGAGGAGALVDEFSYTGDSRPGFDGSGDRWLMPAGAEVPSLAPPSYDAAQAKTLPSAAVPTFAGATLRASPGRRVSRAAVGGIVAALLLVLAAAGVGFVQWRTSQDESTAGAG